MKWASFFFLFAMSSFSGELLSEKPRVIIVRDFLSSEECDYLIRLGRPSLERSTVVDLSSSAASGVVDTRRTSRGMFLTDHSDDRVVKSIEKRLAALAGFPKENGESIQILLYEKGAEYQPHYDFFDKKMPGGSAHLQRGGQRMATVILYLNTPLQGGETVFPTAKISVAPEKGKALLFYNCLPDGEVDSTTLHGGAPVLEGEKWIATKWFRAGRFD